MESLIGKTIDNYRILEVIGHNGIGAMLKALDTNTSKIMTLIMVEPSLAKEENVKYLIRVNTRALARSGILDSVVIQDIRETESGFFILMEYIEDKPLSQHILENGPFSIKDTISISKQLLNTIRL